MVDLKNLIIEPESYRNKYNEKILCNYEESLTSLKERGYQRHLYPSEAIELIIQGIDNPQSIYRPIYEGMILTFGGEWLGAAMQLIENTLTIYLNPGLIFNSFDSNLYQSLKDKLFGELTHDYYLPKGDFEYSEKIEFDLTGIYESELRNKWSSTKIPLSHLPEDLLTFLYSRKFNDLPDMIKKSYMFIPQE